MHHTAGLYNGTFEYQEAPGGSQQSIYIDQEIQGPFYAPTGSMVLVRSLHSTCKSAVWRA